MGTTMFFRVEGQDDLAAKLMMRTTGGTIWPLKVPNMLAKST